MGIIIWSYPTLAFLGMAPSEAGGGGGAPGPAFFTANTVRAGAATASLNIPQTRINTLSTSVADPWLSGVDADPQIQASD